MSSARRSTEIVNPPSRSGRSRLARTRYSASGSNAVTVRLTPTPPSRCGTREVRCELRELGVGGRGIDTLGPPTSQAQTRRYSRRMAGLSASVTSSARNTHPTPSAVHPSETRRLRTHCVCPRGDEESLAAEAQRVDRVVRHSPLVRPRTASTRLPERDSHATEHAHHPLRRHHSGGLHIAPSRPASKSLTLPRSTVAVDSACGEPSTTCSIRGDQGVQLMIDRVRRTRLTRRITPTRWSPAAST